MTYTKGLGQQLRGHAMFFLFASALALSGCGGGSDGLGGSSSKTLATVPAGSGEVFTVAPMGSTENVQSAQARSFINAAVQSTTTTTVTAADLFAWAERSYPVLFPAGPSTGIFQAYEFRFYPSSGWYLGVASGRVYVLNASQTQGQVVDVGAVTDFVEPVSSTSFGPPASFNAAIVKSFTATLTAAADFSNRSRYMISDSASAGANANYLKIDSVYSAAAGYGAASTSIETSSTYNVYLSSLFLVTSDTYGYFRIDSHLHPNNALDYDASDSNELKFRNNFGKAETTYGYITFLYDPQTKFLQAKKRYVYSYTSAAGSGATTYTPTWTEDTGFRAANYFVNHSAGTYKLVAAETSATPLYLYDSPIDLGIPRFMNPNLVEYVTNSPAPFISKVTTGAVEGVNGSIYTGVNATYRPQVTNVGSNSDTKTASASMLASIKSSVEGNGGTLRYSTDLYSAFRDATLKTTLVSDSIADGTPGQNLVPYVYFTNERDDNGTYHPFMIIVSYGNQASPNGLIDVPHPPALGSGSYPSAKVTRFSNLENYIHRIPMRNYGQVTAVTDNAAVITENLWTARRSSSIEANVYTYADAADNGVLVDGSVMFPAYNNNLVPSHLFGELTASGCHVGQGGGGPHCHMDGYQSGSGLGLYNDGDYTGKKHPPLIGFGYDGIALFGKYRGATDAALLGYSTSIDGFGGHNHDDIGYHYHAHTVNNHTPPGQSYSTDMNVLMKGAYIGKVTAVPNFRSRTSKFNNDKYLGGTVVP